MALKLSFLNDFWYFRLFLNNNIFAFHHLNYEGEPGRLPGYDACTTAKRKNFSLRLFRWVMVTALIAGGFLSLAQIALDADRVRKIINDDAQQLLAVVTEPATQAVPHSIDPGWLSR